MSKDLVNSLALERHEDINIICRPFLNLLNVNFFRYLRVFNDGSRIHLCNNPEWTEHFYKYGFYNVAWFDANTNIHTKSMETLWDEKASREDNIVGITAREKFGIYHGLSVIRPSELYYEVFDFATRKDSNEANEIYIKNIDLIDRFVFYFKDKSKEIISKCESKKIKLKFLNLEKSNVDKQVFNKLRDEFIKQTEINRFYLNTPSGDIYLTKKEAQCIVWSILGKSAEEVGMILGISKRTVEIHIDNIRKKLGCSKVSQIIKLAIDSGLFNAINPDFE